MVRRSIGVRIGAGKVAVLAGGRAYRRPSHDQYGYTAYIEETAARPSPRSRGTRSIFAKVVPEALGHINYWPRKCSVLQA
jgi:hypothetical protein